MSQYDLNAYFCHPWKTHVSVNLAMWQAMSADCNLVIDRPTIFEGSDPPFYINRIESLFQQTDIFVACLPFQQQPMGEQCSQFALFEIRMAERAGLTRFVLYDPRTRFQPPKYVGMDSRYVPCRIDELSAQLSSNARLTFVDLFKNWLSWVILSKRPRVERTSFESGILVSSSKTKKGLRTAIQKGMREAGFGTPIDLENDPNGDSDLLEILRSLRLLVVDLSDPKLLPIYHLAHALSIPCLRLHQNDNKLHDNHLPSILRGHTEGYHKDIIRIGSGDQFVKAISERASASASEYHAIVSPSVGNSEIQRRGYVKHLVFVSHDLKGENREVIDCLVQRFDELGIEFFEYETSNRAGDDWRAKMEAGLAIMTHFVAIQSPTYDQSVACTQEMGRARDRESRKEVVIRAFRQHNRGSPSVILRDQNTTHQPLPPDPDAAAKLVTENVLSAIRR
ncbi:MAG: toll/interleukin-1 receptor domain-containing protein [Pirellula sp.]